MSDENMKRLGLYAAISISIMAFAFASWVLFYHKDKDTGAERSGIVHHPGCPCATPDE